MWIEQREQSAVWIERREQPAARIERRVRRVYRAGEGDAIGEPRGVPRRSTDLEERARDGSGPNILSTGTSGFQIVFDPNTRTGSRDGSDP